MEASKNLRRPSNWQDFETLCKKLWGEIWNCPEIKKNGRYGQIQHGVDIYGIPFTESHYFGIQCKGKDEYVNSQFSENEIIAEIEKATKFQPALKKLYFATTAVKDSNIEEFFRKKNIENKSKKLFEIHVFSWEDIVDLIDENKNTHDWYLKSQNYKSNKSVSVKFNNDSTEIILEPKFKKQITHYKPKIVPTTLLFSDPLLNLIGKHQNIAAILNVRSDYDLKINFSYADFSIIITNTGNEPIEEYKVFLDFEGKFQDLDKTNEIGTDYSKILSVNKIAPTTYVWNESKSGKIIPRKNILVGDDFMISENIYIKPIATESEVLIKWKLISKNYKDNGELKIIFNPYIERNYTDILVEDPFQVKIEESEIEDFIVYKKDL